MTAEQVVFLTYIGVSGIAAAGSGAIFYALGRRHGYVKGLWKDKQLAHPGRWPGYCEIMPRCFLDAGHEGMCVEV